MNKLTMLVCPHDTVNEPERWYRLEQYLVQKLGIELQFELSLDLADFRDNLTQAAIVYTNPSDRFISLLDRGYLPVARPMNLYDEVVFVANTEIANPTLELLQGAAICTVTTMIATPLALQMLENRGIEVGSLRHKDSWQGVISSVWNREVDFGFVYKDTYDGLSDSGKALVSAFAFSNEKKAYHTLDISPVLADRKDDIEHVLLTMHENTEGREIVEKLSIGRWLPIVPEEIALMEQLMTMTV